MKNINEEDLIKLRNIRMKLNDTIKDAFEIEYKMNKNSQFSTNYQIIYFLLVANIKEVMSEFNKLSFINK